jgi:carbon-monoxide dehydrogenase large subunit
VFGDTDIVSVGGGSHSGRSMRHAGTVIAMAASDLIEKGRAIAALHFGVPLERIDFDDGAFSVTDSNFRLTVFELARVAQTLDAPDALKGGLAVARDNEMHDPVFPNGTAICEVEIDPDTCDMRITRYSTVDDVGRCINPMIVHGQTHGGIVQGLGQAIFEKVHLEPDTGQLVTGSFMDYGMPRADDMPFFTAEIAEVLSPTNPLGVKAGGEGGTTPALSTLVAAVVDALAPYGVEHIDMPVTPFAIWRAISASKKADEGDST